MNEHGDPRSERIAQIEANLNQVRYRLDRIEARMGIAPPAPQAAAAQEKPAAPKLPAWTPSIHPPKPAPAFDLGPSRTGEDAEFRFGSVVLPRVGAAVMLLGIAYLVGLGIARGIITEWHQFYGALTLCLASIGIGLFKRREQFDFGQVLIGLGSCGLYLTFAGGFAFLKLYEGETLVLQFLLLSLANLFYGAVTPSRTFVAIGLLGGMAASLMPMRDEKIVMSLWLHALIIVPTALVVARHKWREMAVGAWVVSIVAILWPALTAGPWAGQLAVLYGASLICLAAYAYVHDGWEFDPQLALIPFGALATGLVGFCVYQGGRHDTSHEVLFGLALAATSLLLKRKDAQNALLLGGVLAPFVFAPLGLRSLYDSWTYVALAAACALFSFRAFPKAMASLAGVGLGLGLTMYLARLAGDSPISVAQESGLLVAMISVIGLIAYSISRRLRELESITFVAALLMSPMVSRLAAVMMGVPAIGASIEVSVITATMAMAAAGAIVAMRQKWMLMTAFSWMALIVCGFVYLGSMLEHPLTLGLELPILLSMLAVIGLSGGALGKTSGSAEAAGVVAAFAGWGVFSRLVYIVATQPSVGLTGSAAITLAWIIYATLLIVAGFIANMRPLRLSSLAIYGLTLGKVLLYDLHELDPGARVALLILLGMTMIAGGYWYIRRNEPSEKPPAVAA